MVAVAAVAAGLALARTTVDRVFWITTGPVRFDRPFSSFLMVLTLAYMGLRLRRRRPGLRRLMRQPGMTACCAALIALGIDQLTWLLYCVSRGDSARRLQLRVWGLNFDHMACAVAAVWLAMLFRRRWRPEPGWIDRTGRVIGCLWLLKLLLGWPFLRWMLVANEFF
jgi:hypothetical protein